MLTEEGHRTGKPQRMQLKLDEEGLYRADVPAEFAEESGIISGPMLDALLLEPEVEHTHLATVTDIHCQIEFGGGGGEIVLRRQQPSATSEARVRTTKPDAEAKVRRAISELQPLAVGPNAVGDIESAFSDVLTANTSSSYEFDDEVVHVRLLSAIAQRLSADRAYEYARRVSPDSRAWGTAEESIAAVFYRPKDLTASMDVYLRKIAAAGATPGIQGAAIKVLAALAESRGEAVEPWLEVAGDPKFDRVWPARQVRDKFGDGSTVQIGQPLDLSTFKGLPSDEAGRNFELQFRDEKPTLVVLWATWCSICRTHMKVFHDVYRQAGGSFEFLFVNLDDDLFALRNFRRRWPMPWTHAVANSEETLEELGIRGLPYFYLINEDGRVSAQGHDLTRGRLAATLAEYENLEKLAAGDE
ncbi:MAG: TlpA family protein disulfide reductase [Nannocystaceae bacterium]|nr:TlpA family protein disulfide reductase [bacterium]